MNKMWRSILIGVIMLLSTTLIAADPPESQGPWVDDKLHAQDEPRPLQSGCPTDDTYVTNDTILDRETCYVNDTNEDGVLIIETSGITLDCNYANLIGDGTGIAILIRASDVIVQHCMVEMYRIGVKVVSSTSSLVWHNDIQYSSSSAIWIDADSTVITVSYNLISETLS
ncbi:MAG: right-handed parallel beta-helix repeat-containing protein, partial [Thermoplasmata archaeon]|nr:right-handed parallel beta-helix repeat-containing protein [Thermoplasmata archaeon]